MDNGKKSFTTTQIILIALIVSLDFALGMIVKNVLSPTGILQIIRIDMFIPVMLMMLTRLIVDRFGTLIIYELAWSVLSVIAMPAAFGLPGLLKILPALFQGVAYDFIFSSMKRFENPRVYVAAIIGPILSVTIGFALKVALGLPLAGVTITLLSIQVGVSTAVHILGAYGAIVVWKRIKTIHLVKRIQATG